MTPEPLVVDLGHLRMHALAWGPPDGRLALCLHGFPDSAWGWAGLAEVLAGHGLRVVAPFTRGYAPTGPAPDDCYHIGALAYDAAQLHHHLGGGDDAILIGHDWGAFTVNALAAAPNSPFAAHVCMAVPPLDAVRQTPQPLTRQVPILLDQLRRSWYVLFFQLPRLPERLLPRVIPRLWRDWAHPDQIPNEALHTALDAALDALPGAAHRHAAVSYYRTLPDPRRPAPKYAELHQYRFQIPRVPTLQLHGTHDGAINAAYTDTIASVLPAGSRVRTFTAGHFLHIEQPDAIADAILEFL